jgi:hypothetical protein
VTNIDRHKAYLAVRQRCFGGRTRSKAAPGAQTERSNANDRLIAAHSNSGDAAVVTADAAFKQAGRQACPDIELGPRRRLEPLRSPPGALFLVGGTP